MQKKKKKKEDSKVHDAKTIDRRDFWLVPYERGKLAMNIKKCILPVPKILNYLKFSQTKNEKLYFYPTFQKVKSRNSTFFRPSYIKLYEEGYSL